MLVLYGNLRLEESPPSNENSRNISEIMIRSCVSQEPEHQVPRAADLYFPSWLPDLSSAHGFIATKLSFPVLGNNLHYLHCCVILAISFSPS